MSAAAKLGPIRRSVLAQQHARAGELVGDAVLAQCVPQRGGVDGDDRLAQLVLQALGEGDERLVGADLHAAVDQLCDRLRDRPVGAFLQALIVAAAADPGAVALRHRYVGDLLAPFHTVLRTAGVPATDREDAVAAIGSPLLLDALLLDRPAARTRAHRIVDTVARRLTRP